MAPRPWRSRQSRRQRSIPGILMSVTIASLAVAHAILVSVYHVLARQIPYRDLGPDYYDHRHAERVRRRAIAALERQGYRVTLQPAA